MVVNTILDYEKVVGKDSGAEDVNLFGHVNFS
ncbi:hypothetical protein KR51_00022960 [Rubidibacter lacunae KORDI 51-2]|uniref:Uncharacterized protein n=1 Tax=Rubidibacter lacunae KORDI 51-2 TaxID=582515 RepID=U5DKD8_9CHRO|nr:hypothetical protein KR51_00022960 [Rubidibacter lacunae KORDI 51-2]